MFFYPLTLTDMKLALFDFDGTITNKDTYTDFLFSVSPKSRILIGCFLVSPIILAYKLGWLSASKTRPVLSKVTFWGRSKHQVAEAASHYVNERLPQYLRPDMLEKIRWHKAEGHRIILVSANLDVLLSTWCQQNQIEWVCSELVDENGTYNGNYVQGDCSHTNKVRFLKQRVDLAQYQYVYAYGDTDEDLPLLSLADEATFCGQPYP